MSDNTIDFSDIIGHEAKPLPQPNFTVSNQSGYMEEQVDQWFRQVLPLVNKAILDRNRLIHENRGLIARVQEMEQQVAEARTATNSNNALIEYRAQAEEVLNKANAEIRRLTELNQQLQSEASQQKPQQAAAPAGQVIKLISAAELQNAEETLYLTEEDKSQELLSRASIIALSHLHAAKEEANKIVQEATASLPSLQVVSAEVQELINVRDAVRQELEAFFKEGNTLLATLSDTKPNLPAQQEQQDTPSPESATAVEIVETVDTHEPETPPTEVQVQSID